MSEEIKEPAPQVDLTALTLQGLDAAIASLLSTRALLAAALNGATLEVVPQGCQHPKKEHVETFSGKDWFCPDCGLQSISGVESYG